MPVHSFTSLSLHASELKGGGAAAIRAAASFRNLAALSRAEGCRSHDEVSAADLLPLRHLAQLRTLTLALDKHGRVSFAIADDDWRALVGRWRQLRQLWLLFGVEHSSCRRRRCACSARRSASCTASCCTRRRHRWRLATAPGCAAHS
jgi:hypothetical protein